MEQLNKPLIIGASGLLGRKFLSTFRQKFNGSVIGTSYSKDILNLISLDVTNNDQVFKFIDKQKPSLIINCSAFTDVGQAEVNWLESYKINASGNYYLATAANRINIPYISFSTDYVFKGHPESYIEAIKPDPISVYGKTKVLGETSTLISNEKNIVIRVPILYGYNSSEDKLTVPTSVINACNQGKILKISDPRPKYPLLIDDIVTNTLQLLEHGQSGIFHFSIQESITKYQWALMTADIFELNKTLIKKEKPKYASYKPSNVLLMNTKIKNAKFQSVKDGLKVVKSQMMKKIDG